MAKENNETSAERIRTLIETKCGGSQQRFADLCGIGKYSVSQYVNAKNSPGNVTAVKISRAFGVDPLWVMGENVPMYKERYNKTLELTDEEENMIYRYRACLQSHREAIRQMIDAFYVMDGEFR